MKCQVCKINEAAPNSIVCGDRCKEVRLKIIRLSNKYTPTNGCDNCWGDLHQGCTEKCKEEGRIAHEFVCELYFFVRGVLNTP